VPSSAFEEDTEVFTGKKKVVKLNHTMRIAGLVAAISAGLYLQEVTASQAEAEAEAEAGAEADLRFSSGYVVPNWRASLITVDVLSPSQG
jgi:signal transduction histidine kinase